MIVTNAPTNVARTLGRVFGHADSAKIVFDETGNLFPTEQVVASRAMRGDDVELLWVVPEGISEDESNELLRVLSRTRGIWRSVWAYHQGPHPYVVLVSGEMFSGALSSLHEVVGAIRAKQFSVEVRPTTGYGQYAVVAVSSRGDSQTFYSSKCSIRIRGTLCANTSVVLYPGQPKEVDFLLSRIQEQNDEATEASYGTIEVCTKMLTQAERDRMHELDELTRWT